jgi:hypothetical protein
VIPSGPRSGTSNTSAASSHKGDWPHTHTSRLAVRFPARSFGKSWPPYHQVWWPSTRSVAYPAHTSQPVWDDSARAYIDPNTGIPLQSWDEAMDELDQVLDDDPDREPAHVVRFGRQVDVKGVLIGTPEADKLIGYLTKYLTTSVTECHQVETAAADAHKRRVWEELRYTPCSPRCANWLRYGIQPLNAKDRMRRPATAKPRRQRCVGTGRARSGR